MLYQSSSVSLLLLHNRALIRDSLAFVLATNTQFNFLGGWSTSDLDLIPAEVEPTLILLDSTASFSHNSCAVAVVQSYWCNSAIVLLGDPQSHAQVHRALYAGVRGFISESLALPMLIHAIETITDGNTVYDPQVITLIASRDVEEDTAQTTNTKKVLTLQEQKILKLVRCGLTNKAIADRLNLAPKTIEGHLTRIFRKTHLYSRFDLFLEGKHLSQVTDIDISE